MDSNVGADLKAAGLELDESENVEQIELGVNTLLEAPYRFVGKLVYMHFPAELPRAARLRYGLYW